MAATGPIRQGGISATLRSATRMVECAYDFAAGIEDLRHQRQTVAALLVAIGAPKLRSLGLEVPENLPSNPEHRLYDLLSVPDPDSAHSKYNALIRRLRSAIPVELTLVSTLLAV